MIANVVFGSIWMYSGEIMVSLQCHVWSIWEGNPDAEKKWYSKNLQGLLTLRVYGFRKRKLSHVVCVALVKVAGFVWSSSWHHPASRHMSCYKVCFLEYRVGTSEPCYNNSVKTLSIHFLSILLFHQLVITRYRKCTQKGLVLVTM